MDVVSIQCVCVQYNIAIASSIAHCALMYCFVLSCSNLVRVF